MDVGDGTLVVVAVMVVVQYRGDGVLWTVFWVLQCATAKTHWRAHFEEDTDHA